MNPGDYTVLVAEDEEASRFLYQEELGDDGYRVLTAENGLQVLGTLEDEPVDLLVTDVKMPDMNALELIPRVRKEFSDMPILVVSAFKAMESDFALKESNISGFFAKPVNLEALRFKIKEILEKRKPRRGNEAKSARAQETPVTLKIESAATPPEKTILIAEDMESSRTLYEGFLLEKGFRVIGVRNGMEALNVIKSTNVDLVLTDVKMPEMNALDLIPNVRAHDPKIPIVVVTAYPALVEAFDNHSFKVEAIFLKPVVLEDLLKKIVELMPAAR